MLNIYTIWAIRSTSSIFPKDRVNAIYFVFITKKKFILREKIFLIKNHLYKNKTMKKFLSYFLTNIPIEVSKLQMCTSFYIILRVNKETKVHSFAK